MHTLIRDRDISKHDFVFYSDRLIRLVHNDFGFFFKIYVPIPICKLILASLILQVVEHGLGHLPFAEKQIMTPTGLSNECKFHKFIDFAKQYDGRMCNQLHLSESCCKALLPSHSPIFSCCL